MYIRIVFLYMILAGSLLSQENQISITFSELPALLEKSSPQFKIIDAMQKITETRRDAALQWSNPEINYFREHIENSDLKETEQLLYLSKTATFPWIYFRERSVWNSELNAAESEREYKIQNLLATTRAEYIRLSLLSDLIKNQTELKKILTNLKSAIMARQEEGAISNLEAALLSMSIFGAQTDLVHTQQAFRNSLNTLKRLLGIQPANEIILTTEIRFIRIQRDFASASNFLENHPGLKAQQSRLEALEKSVTLERSRIVPYVSLHGGYKKINQDWEGYTVGVSVPLPLLNWNGPQIEEQKIQEKIQHERTHLYKQNLESTEENLLATIQASMNLLQETVIEKQNFTIVEDLLLAYQEGVISLTEFLNSISLYRDGVKQYNDQLTMYYQAIFEFEALSGQQLIAL